MVCYVGLFKKEKTTIIEKGKKKEITFSPKKSAHMLWDLLKKKHVLLILVFSFVMGGVEVAADEVE